MATEFAARELDRVQLEQPRITEDDEGSRHSDSEYESSVAEDEGDVDYDVEAIKWAVWRDSRRDRQDGWVGWHYGVLWQDYLKTLSETEEPKRLFAAPSKGVTDVLREFWNSLDHTVYVWAVLGKNQREPTKPPYKNIGQRVEAPESLLRRRFTKSSTNKGKREYETFVARQRWLRDNGLYEASTISAKVVRRVSDHYQYPKIKARRSRERQEKRERQLAEGGTQIPDGSQRADGTSSPKKRKSEERPGPAEAGPSTSTISHRPASSVKTSNASTSERPAPPLPTAVPSVPSVSAANTTQPSASAELSRVRSIDSLFDEQPSTAGPSTTSTPSENPLATNGKKRKIVDSPEPGPAQKAARIEKTAGPTSTTSGDANGKGKSSTAALARIGKIAKNKDDPLSRAGSVQPSFGEPQPGIFEQLGPCTHSAPAPPSIVATTPLTGTAKEPPPAPISTGRPPANAAPVSKLFIDPEDIAPSVSPTTSKPIEVKSEPVTATVGPTAPPSPKIPLSDRPKYQQPSRIKLIDDVPPAKLPRKASSGFGIPGNASPVDPSTRPAWKIPLYPSYFGQSPEAGGRTPTAAASAVATQPKNAAFPPRNSVPTPQTSGFPGPSFGRPTQAPTQPKTFRPPRPIPSNHLPPPPVAASRPIPTGLSNRVSRLPNKPPSPPLPSALRPSLDPGPSISAFNVAADPRRKGSAHTSPVLPGLTSPHSPPGGTGRTPTHLPSGERPRMPLNPSYTEFSVALEITAIVPDVPTLDMHLLPGAALSTSGPSLSQALLRREGGMAALTFEEVEPIAVRGNIRLGAKVVEWVRAARMGKHDASSKQGDPWTQLKDTLRENKVYVCYAELEATNPKHHYAILLATPSVVDISHLGLGQWKGEDITAGIFVLQLPLTSIPPPQLSNPVLPTIADDEKPDLSTFQSVDILGSYGISDEFLNQYRGRKVVKYPPPDHRLDVFDRQLTLAFKRNEILGVQPKSSPDFVVLLNHGLGRSMRSSTIRNVVLRRTPIYASGPSLSLYPSQYGNQRIWQQGALVTFSPSFILHSPDRFAAAMRLVRASRHWAAYITPGVIEWCQASWSIPARCPDNAVAYRELNKALVFDHAFLKISGNHADSGGDLAVSCAPPSIHDEEGCAAWQSWLFKVAKQTDFDGIVSASQGVSKHTFKSDSVDDKKATVTYSDDLVDIEQGQLEDLTAMRMMPHLLPYRRYLYVGEVSLPQADKDHLGATIEFISGENFTATFSSVV